MEPPTYSYVDQLLSDTWVTWSEKYLHKQQPAQFSTGRGWQDYVEHVAGSVNANERTRAKELFECGLLRGRLVRSRDGGSTGPPYGWGLIQSDEHVHTKLGHAGYAIGKALADHHASPAIDAALSVIAAIMILQKGVPVDGTYILLVSVFEHLRTSYNKPAAISEHLWNRWLAAAMFVTLNDSVKSGPLLSDVRSGTTTTTLILSPTSPVTPTSLATLAKGAGSLNDYSRKKAALFWIGNPNDTSPRGIYTIARQNGIAAKLLDDSVTIQKRCQDDGQSNPFAALAKRASGQDVPCMFELLDGIFSIRSEYTTTWETAVKTLYEGVLDALSCLAAEQSHTSGTSQVLYAHGVTGDPIEGRQINVSVAPKSCVKQPRIGDWLVVDKLHYRVTSVLDESGAWKIEARR